MRLGIWLVGFGIFILIGMFSIQESYSQYLGVSIPPSEEWSNAAKNAVQEYVDYKLLQNETIVKNSIKTRIIYGGTDDLPPTYYARILYDVIYNKEIQHVDSAYKVVFLSWNNTSADAKLEKTSETEYKPPKKIVYSYDVDVDYLNNFKYQMIMCRQGFEKIMKVTTEDTVCVKPKTAISLIERGWGKIKKPYDQSIETIKAFEITVTGEQVTPIEISDERILTHSTSIQDQDALSSIGGCPTNWPVYSIDTPSQVVVGKEFDVIIDYSYVIPDIDAGYEDPDDVFEPDKYHELCLDSEILIRTPSFVKILDQRYVHEGHQERWDTSPPTLRDEGIIPYEFDNTGPQQEIITMRIDQPRFGDQLAEIYITPGHTVGVTRTIAIHDNIVNLIETDTELVSWTVDDFQQHEAMLSKIRNSFGIPEPITINNQTWIDQLTPEYSYNPRPPQGNPPDMDEFAAWLLQLPFPDDVRYMQILSRDFPQSYLDNLFEKYPELLPAQ